MIIEGNPFFWDFREQRAMKTLAQQKNAQYSEPQEVKEQDEDLYDFYAQKYGHCPNIAHITGIEPLENPPYTDTKAEPKQ